MAPEGEGMFEAGSGGVSLEAFVGEGSSEPEVVEGLGPGDVDGDFLAYSVADFDE